MVRSLVFLQKLHVYLGKLKFMCVTSQPVSITFVSIFRLKKGNQNIRIIENFDPSLPLIRIDKEARRSEGWIEEISNYNDGKYYDRIKVIVGPQLYGYCSIQTYLDEMASIAKGTFFFHIQEIIQKMTC